jgi:cell division protein FtsB
VRQLVAIGVLAVGLLLAAAFAGVAMQGNAVDRESAQLRAEIAALQADLASKQAAVAEKQTDQYVVDKARELGFVRPGEALVAVQPDVGSGRSVVADVGGPARIAKWWALFFR